jgi:hypothetical protein
MSRINTAYARRKASVALSRIRPGSGASLCLLLFPCLTGRILDPIPKGTQTIGERGWFCDISSGRRCGLVYDIIPLTDSWDLDQCVLNKHEYTIGHKVNKYALL